MKGSDTRVVITGMGAVTPLGETDRRILGQPCQWCIRYWTHGRSAIPSEYPSRISAEVSDFDPGTYIDRREHRRMARFSQMSVAAAGLAIEDAGLDLSKEDGDRIGVVMGNGNGGFPDNRGQRAHSVQTRRYEDVPILHPDDSSEHGRRPMSAGYTALKVTPRP